MRSTNRLRIDLTMICVVGVALLINLAVKGMEVLKAESSNPLSLLPTITPTPLPTSGWWSDTRFFTPTLPSLGGLPGLPAVSLDEIPSGVGGVAVDQPVPFQVSSCPTSGVHIEQIVTGKPGWWSIHGTAQIDNLWYWKGELSSDGSHWSQLYRSESPVNNATLINFLTRTVAKGRYQLRLTAVNKTGNYPEPCIVQVEVR